MKFSCRRARGGREQSTKSFEFLSLWQMSLEIRMGENGKDLVQANILQTSPGPWILSGEGDAQKRVKVGSEHSH